MKQQAKIRGIYLKKAHLQGFRTIQNTQVSFCPGLNIIIGKNGIGKTNFMEFLADVLLVTPDKVYQSVRGIFESSITLGNQKNEELTVHTKRELKITDVNGTNTTYVTENYQASFAGSSKVSLPKEEVFMLYYESNFYTQTAFVKCITPKLLLLSEKAKLTYRDGHIVTKNDDEILVFSGYLIIHIIRHYLQWHSRNKDKVIWKTELIERIQQALLPLQAPLKKLSSIEAVRASDSFHICETEEGIVLDNLFLECKIAGQWLPYTHLSDSTKRIFYIISEVVFAGLDSIILLEQPELGVQPHQLYLLMSFLKEAAEDKQIILTTHAPQVINFLKKEELDRLIITTISKKGNTELRHLTSLEKQQVIEYMKELDLGDYWLHSDLEEEE